MFSKFASSAVVAGLLTIGLAPGAARAATPVTFHYDSGVFTDSPRAQSARFGTHFTADLTYSQDFDYTIRPLQHLNNIATLLDWTVTSGDFVLNSANATFTADITDYFSTLFTNPLVTINFAVVGHVDGVPVNVTARSDLNMTDGIGVNPAITCGDFARVCGTDYRNFNLGGGHFTKTFDYGGSGGGGGGSGSGGGSGGGGSGGGPGGVPEPASWALMITGFGLMGAALRRQRLGLPA